MLSNCTIDTFFNYNNYLERLKEGALEKKSNTTEIVNQKSKEILEKLKCFIDLNGIHPGKLNEINSSIIDISKTRPGRKLFKLLIKNNNVIKLVWNDLGRNCCMKKDLINLNSTKFYYHSLSPEGKFQMTLCDGVTTMLFHEWTCFFTI